MNETFSGSDRLIRSTLWSRDLKCLYCQNAERCVVCVWMRVRWSMASRKNIPQEKNGKFNISFSFASDLKPIQSVLTHTHTCTKRKARRTEKDLSLKRFGSLSQNRISRRSQSQTIERIEKSYHIHVHVIIISFSLSLSMYRHRIIIIIVFAAPESARDRVRASARDHMGIGKIKIRKSNHFIPFSVASFCVMRDGSVRISIIYKFINKFLYRAAYSVPLLVTPYRV